MKESIALFNVTNGYLHHLIEVQICRSFELTFARVNLLMPTEASSPSISKEIKTVSGITVRLCGDSGDGMQLLGTQLTNTSALAGNDIATFPDFPAEIRAPRGTRAGVSGFQVQFASHEVHTPGDSLDALVAMNPSERTMTGNIN